MKRLVAAVIGLTIVAALAFAWWTSMGARREPAPVAEADAQTPQDAAATPVLSGRLTLLRDGDAALGIVRLFDARARNGFTQGGASVTVSRAAIEAGIALEVEQNDGAVGTGTRPIVVRTPADRPQQLQADTTLEVWADLPALPPGGRVRVSLPVGEATIVTDWVEVPPTPTAPADVLSLRARVQRAKGDPELAATAEQLVAEAPDDARGYYYRGLALEAGGDRAGAIAAYEAALERTPRDGQEPPVAIYRRLARLRAAQ